MGNKKADVREQLELLYGCRDMLTMFENESLDFHHILKEISGGEYSVDNGALLEKISHQWLHYIEKADPELYVLINECLSLYKKCIDLEKEDLISQYQEEVVPLAIELIEQYENSATKKELKKKRNRQKEKYSYVYH